MTGYKLLDAIRNIKIARYESVCFVRVHIHLYLLAKKTGVI